MTQPEDIEASRIALLLKWRERQLAELGEHVTDIDGNVFAVKDFVDLVHEEFVKRGWPVICDATGRLQVVKPHKH